MSTPSPAGAVHAQQDLEPDRVRVRFCPSPTGTPHLGMVRTALYNWAHARHTGGRLVFRVEDTDAARDSEESYQKWAASRSFVSSHAQAGSAEQGAAPTPVSRSAQLLSFEVVQRVGKDNPSLGQSGSF